MKDSVIIPLYFRGIDYLLIYFFFVFLNSTIKQFIQNIDIAILPQ